MPDEGKSLSEQENLERAQKAIEWAFRNKQRVNGVVYRGDVGRVDLWVGRAGIKDRDYTKGEGIMHIETKHPDDVSAMALTIAKGKVVDAYNVDGTLDKKSKLLKYKGYLAKIGHKEDSSSSWIITHYYAAEK